MRAPRFVRPLSVTAWLTAMSAALASAQTSPILPSTKVVLAGPVSFYPTIALRDAGTDSNVYIESENPKQDFTYSVVPRLYVVAPIGNTRFIGTGFGDIVYYQTYKDQQSISGSFQGRYEVVSPGLRPFAIIGFADRRERRGLEIDARVRQRQKTVSAGAEMDVTSKTAVTGWFRRVKTGWDRNAQYFEALLSEQLDYNSNTVAGGARFRATPLTTISLTAELSHDRFDHEPLRNADKLFVGPSAEFDGAELIGRVRAGYQRFSPLNPTLAQYDGLAAAASVQYTFFDLTRIKVDFDRDVDYSYDTIQPYYLESGGLLTIAHRIIGPFEIVATGERRSLQNRRLGSTSFDGRYEVTRTVGGGVAIQIRKQMRFEVIYDRRARKSSEPFRREYERRRVYGAAVYGL
jgi:putative beta-barrel porin BBP2